jgi:cell division septum initiation protein DivIVA
MRRLLIFASLLVVLEASPAVSAGSPFQYFSSDAHRSRIEHLILVKASPKHAPPGDAVYSKAEVDALLTDLLAEILKAGVSKSELAQAIAAATQPLATKAGMDASIQKATEASERRESVMSKTISPASSSPLLPVWTSPAIALVALLLSAALPLWNRKSLAQTINQARIHTIKDAAAARAKDCVSDWQQQIVEDYTSALAALRGPKSITDPTQLGIIVKAGNFFDRLAYGVRDHTIDAPTIREAGLNGYALDFKEALTSRTEPTLVFNRSAWSSLQRWQ